VNSAQLETLGNFTENSPHRFVALTFIYQWNVSNSSFLRYLQDAYIGFPFVVSFGQSELSTTRLIADQARIKPKIYPKENPTINFPTLQKMIFVEMTRKDLDPSPFEEFAAAKSSLHIYEEVFRVVGLYQTLDVVVISSPTKVPLLLIIPDQLGAKYPDIGQGEVELPSISTTTAAAMMCIMMKPPPVLSTSSSISLTPSSLTPACIQFITAWRKHAKALKAGVNISKTFSIGLMDFTICSVVEEHVSLKHFSAHCVMNSGRFVVDDMIAECYPTEAGQREHGPTTVMDKKIPWKVDSKLVMLFAVRTEDYREKQKPRSQGKTTELNTFQTNISQ